VLFPIDTSLLKSCGMARLPGATKFLRLPFKSCVQTTAGHLGNGRTVTVTSDLAVFTRNFPLGTLRHRGIVSNALPFKSNTNILLLCQGRI